MNKTCIRSIAAIFVLTLMSGCVGYSYPYGHYSMPMGNGYGYGGRYPRQMPYGNFGYSNYQAYQPYRGHVENHERAEYRENEYGGEGRGYGQYRRHHDDD